jgi:hypothetical protein
LGSVAFLGARRQVRTASTESTSRVKVTFYTVFGVVLVAVAVVALIRPSWALPAKKHEETVANQQILIETRRVISIPRVASATELVLGLGLIFFGSRPPREIPRRRR